MALAPGIKLGEYEIGQRFLMIKEGSSNEGRELRVVLNWAEELKRPVPTE